MAKEGYNAKLIRHSMTHERPFSQENESLPPYPYNVPGLSAAAFRRVQAYIRTYQQYEHPPVTNALIHQWCWEARLAERGTMPVDPSQQSLPVDTQRPRVEYVATPNGYLPKLIFPPAQEISPRRNTGESERTLSKTMKAAGHASYTLMKTALQHPELTSEHLATVNDFAFDLHDALLTSAQTGDMASLYLNLPDQDGDTDIASVISQALVVPGSPRLYISDNALPARLNEQYYQQSIIPDVFIDTRRPSYAPDSFPVRSLAGYDRVPAQVKTYFTGNA